MQILLSLVQAAKYDKLSSQCPVQSAKYDKLSSQCLVQSAFQLSLSCFLLMLLTESFFLFLLVSLE